MPAGVNIRIARQHRGGQIGAAVRIERIGLCGGDFTGEYSILHHQGHAFLADHQARALCDLPDQLIGRAALQHVFLPLNNPRALLLGNVILLRYLQNGSVQTGRPFFALRRGGQPQAGIPVPVNALSPGGTLYRHAFCALGGKDRHGAAAVFIQRSLHAAAGDEDLSGLLSGAIHPINGQRAALPDAHLAILAQGKQRSGVLTRQAHGELGAVSQADFRAGSPVQGQHHQPGGRNGQTGIAITAAGDPIAAAAVERRVRQTQVDGAAAHTVSRNALPAALQRVLLIQQPSSQGTQGHLQAVWVQGNMLARLRAAGRGLLAIFVGMVAKRLVPGLLRGFGGGRFCGYLRGCGGFKVCGCGDALAKGAAPAQTKRRHKGQDAPSLHLQHGSFLHIRNPSS